MDGIIKQIEKMKPTFEKISRNIYLRAIRDGFISVMPVILFSSVFLLVAFVPNIFGYEWSKETVDMLMKPYGYTMGVVGLLVAGTTAKALTDSFNRKLEKTNQINFLSTMIASMTGFLILAADSIEGGFSNSYLGTKGLLTSFIVAFITVNLYNVCIKNNVTIKMPKEVPPNISQVFKDMIPFGLTIILIYILDLTSRKLLGVSMAESVTVLMRPLFTAAEGYLGITVIFGAYALFWFVGIHGPSIVEPAIAAIIYTNIETNYMALHAGQHADKILTAGTQMFIVTMGGTGATLVVPFMFMWLSKAKRNKAIGKASVIPTFFGVNEPILFGAPIVLNPIFFIPFVFAPIANVWIFKFFIDVLNMNSFSIFLPWTTPAPLGIILGTGLSLLSLILAVLLIIVDVLIYYPFFRIFDNQVLEEEKTGKTNEELKTKVLKNFDTKKADDILKEKNINILKEKEINVLVLCAGGGTSGLLANALTKAAKENNINLKGAAGSYGAHMDIMKDYDLIILAPQVASNYNEIKQDADRIGVKLVKTEGMEYIKLTRDGKGALEFVNNALNS